MESYEEILKRMQEAYQEASGHCPDDVSDTGLRLRVLSGELYRLQAKLAWLERQAFPQTATGNWLDKHGVQRGVVRREAGRAQGELTFSRYIPLSFDLVIPKGTVCASTGENPVEYETTEEGILAADTLNVVIPARAVRGGKEGNVGAGYINTLRDPTTSVNYVNNEKAFTGGTDPEDDEAYRARILVSYDSPSSGANVGYYREVALACNGVGAAGIIPRANGTGTVGVYIWGVTDAPSEETISELEETFSKEREAGVKVTVQAATAKTVNVGVRLKLRPGSDFTRTQQDVEQAVGAYFASLTVGSPVYLAELQRVILDVAPAVKLEFPVTMYDISANQSVVPVLGTVTVEELE